MRKQTQSETHSPHGNDNKTTNHSPIEMPKREIAMYSNLGTSEGP